MDWEWMRRPNRRDAPTIWRGPARYVVAADREAVPVSVNCPKSR